ncbi:hypothetical protein N8Z24_00600 [bacterium]|nr:hypothetical protein [bacterium]
MVIVFILTFISGALIAGGCTASYYEKKNKRYRKDLIDNIAPAVRRTAIRMRSYWRVNEGRGSWLDFAEWLRIKNKVKK